MLPTAAHDFQLIVNRQFYRFGHTPPGCYPYIYLNTIDLTTSISKLSIPSRPFIMSDRSRVFSSSSSSTGGGCQIFVQSWNPKPANPR